VHELVLRLDDAGRALLWYLWLLLFVVIARKVPLGCFERLLLGLFALFLA
jgi:hypothetical protein